MSSEQGDFRINVARNAKVERRRREQMHRRGRRLLWCRNNSVQPSNPSRNAISLRSYRSNPAQPSDPPSNATSLGRNNSAQSFEPRSNVIPLRRTHQRTRRNWRGINQDCLRLIEDCQQIIGRLQSDVNHLSNQNDNLLSSASNFMNQIPTEEQPESRLDYMLENLNCEAHYQPRFITSQTIERLMSPSQPSSSLCPLQIIEVSLVCPLSKTKIKLPIRGKHCKHLGCCDASTFLSLVGEKPFSKWKCPICSLPMPYEDIKVDGLLSHVIKEVKQEAMKIEFTSSIEWRVKEEKEASLSTHKLHKSKAKEIIDLTYSPQPKAEQSDSRCHFIDLTNSP